MTSNDTHSLNSGSDELGFEEAFRQLTEIAERLEAGGLTLADATARYEEGMKLVQHCNQLLDSAELEITTLRENYQRQSSAISQPDGLEQPYFEEAPYEEIVEEEDDLPF